MTDTSIERLRELISICQGVETEAALRELLAIREHVATAPVNAANIDILFDGPPGPIAGRFVEVEDMGRKSLRRGEWVHRPDGFCALRIDDPAAITREREAAAAVLLGVEAVRDEYWRAVVKEVARAETAEARVKKLETALDYIVAWKLPPTDSKWDDGTPMSFGAAYGSNGEREHMRDIARAALAPQEPAATTAPVSAKEGL